MQSRRRALLLSVALAAVVVGVLVPLVASADPFALYLPLALRNKSGGGDSPANPTPAPPTVPAAPSGLAVDPVSSSRLALSWDDNSDNESGFHVERAPGGTSDFELLTALGPDTSYYEDSGLAAGTGYRYRVRACGAAGCSSYCSAVTGTTVAVNAPPAAPSDLTAHNVTDSSVYLTWTDNSDNEAGFHLYQGIPETGAPPWEIGAGVLLADYTAVTVIELPADRPHMFWISAYNDIGESAWSEPVVIRTAAQAVTATRFCNSTSHPIISLEVDGVEHFPASPWGILSGQCYDVPLAPGTHSFSAANGFWQDTYSRFEMYTWSGTVQQVDGELYTVTFYDPTIEVLMSQFGPVAYWHGMYWTYTPYATPHTAAYCFYDTGTYRFYVDGAEHSTGTYYLVQRGDLFTKFATSAGHEGMLYEAYGQFDMLQSPPNNQFTEYNVYPGTCPATAP